MRDVADAVAVGAGEARDLVVGRERAREDEVDLALAEHVGRPVADAGLRPRVGVPVEAEGVLVVVGALLGVPDPELDVVPALERHRVGRGHGWIVLGRGLRSGDGEPGETAVADGRRARRRPRRRARRVAGRGRRRRPGRDRPLAERSAGPSSPATASAARWPRWSRPRARTSSAGSSRRRCSARRERPTTEMNMLAPDGSHVPIEVSAVVVEGTGHRIVGVFGTIRPVAPPFKPPPLRARADAAPARGAAPSRARRVDRADRRHARHRARDRPQPRPWDPAGAPSALPARGGRRRAAARAARRLTQVRYATQAASRHLGRRWQNVSQSKSKSGRGRSPSRPGS